MVLISMINQSPQQKSEILQQLLQEINLIPTDQQENLLRLIKIFRLAITENYHETELKSIEEKQDDQFSENQEILDLLNKWEAEEDEQEQTETLAYLQEVLS